jgi:hypothetical protein
MLRLLTLGSLLLFTFSACELPKLPEKKEMTTFFSLERYFKSEEGRLSKKATRYKKHIKTNSEEEDLMLNVEDWSTEFQLFKKSDINKPSWKDDYKIDSVLVEGKLRELTYLALKDDLYTKSLSIKFKGKKVQMISISNKSENSIYRLEETLNYNPDKGYKIERKQDLLLFEEERHSIEVFF